MSAHVLLKLGRRDQIQGLPDFLSLSQSLINSIHVIQEHEC